MKIDAFKLKVALAERIWLINDLADKSGVTSNTIQSILAGNSCNTVTLGKIAKALDVPVVDLLKE